jgi:hypothetical protein
MGARGKLHALRPAGVIPQSRRCGSWTKAFKLAAPFLADATWTSHSVVICRARRPHAS